MNREEFLSDLPGLVASYKPAPASLTRIGNVKLLIVIGPSGVGKTTLINQLGIPYVPSDTTRQPREGEQDGVDMFFIRDLSQATADLRDGRFVQVAVGPTGDLYATRASSYPESGWASMPVVADVVPVSRSLGFDKTLSIFVMPPSYEEWMRRMGAHHLTDEQLQRRLAEARRSLKFGLEDKDTNFILNDEVDSAVAQIKGLLSGNIDHKREELAKNAAKDSLSRIS